MFRVIEQGSTFESYMAKMKFKAMLQSSEDSLKIKHLVSSYRTAVQKFQVGFKKEICAPADTDLEIFVDKHTSGDLLKITSQDGSMLYADKATLKKGKKVVVKVP